jgi:hypothetical protein
MFANNFLIYIIINSVDLFLPTRALGPTSRITKYQLIYFIIWPFAALIHSLKNFRNPTSKTIFWLFCVYFGFVFIYVQPYSNDTPDSTRYAARLINMHDNPVTFTELISGFYNEKVLDIYQPITTWLISLITGDPRLLFAVYAAVFGFFYTQNLWLIFDVINRKIGLILVLFMLAYALTNPIWQINGVRMWTAAQLFLYGILIYFLKSDYKGFIWCAVSIFIHFSFLFPFAILIIWLFLPEKVTLYFILYLISAFLYEIKIDFIRNLVSYLPDILQNKMHFYINDAAIERVSRGSAGLSVHVVLARISERWIIHIIVFLIYINVKYLKFFLPKFYHLFVFALILGGVANMTTSLLSGGRFLTLSSGLFLAIFIAVLGAKQIKIRHNYVLISALPLLIFFILYEVRMGLMFTGILTYLGNPLIAPFINDQIPLIDMIKHLFT